MVLVPAKSVRVDLAAVKPSHRAPAGSEEEDVDETKFSTQKTWFFELKHKDKKC